MKKALLFVLCFGTSLFADGAAAPAREGGGMAQTFIMIAIAISFFYFILWRPEQKRRKALETQRNAMKPGDRITAMGIVGTLSAIKETTVVVKNVDGSKIEILKAAITNVESSSPSEEESKA